MTAISWIVTDAIRDRSEAERQYWTDRAWAAWAKASCVERHGDHSWLAELDPLEEGGCVNLACQYCPADVDDVYPNGTDAMVGEVDGIPVAFGRTRTLEPYTAEVSVRLVVEHYPSTPAHDEEWDVWVEVGSLPVLGGVA